jgi:hypothetical protein
MAEKKTKRTYRAADGAPFNPKLVQKIGEELERLGETITPPEFVVAAKRKGSVLNRLIDWNDRTAAAKYRLWQARAVLNHINVVVLIGGEEREMKAFYSQTVVVGYDEEAEEDVMQRRYISISLAEREPLSARNIVDQAKADLDCWRERYQRLRAHFAPVFEAIEKA